MTRKTKTLVIGLTGSIGMGKTTCARLLAKEGLPVFSADEASHALMQPGEAGYKALARQYPQLVTQKGVRRKALSQCAFQQPELLKWLESILHPQIMKACRAFIRDAKRQEQPAAVLDVPLLFETSFDALCDLTVCVSAKAATQKQRVLKRKNMTPAKLKAILARQMPDEEKRRRADFVLSTEVSRAQTRRDLRAWLISLGVARA